MFYYSRNQQSQLHSTLTSPTEQTHSFELFNHQKQDESFNDFITNLMPSLSTCFELNQIDSEYRASNSPIEDWMSLIQGFDKSELPDTTFLKEVLSYLAKNFKAQKLKLTGNPVMHNYRNRNTKATKNLSILTLRIKYDISKSHSVIRQEENAINPSLHYGKFKFHLLNPIYLLVRIRTSQFTAHFSNENPKPTTKASISKTEEFDLGLSGMSVYKFNNSEHHEGNQTFPKFGSHEDPNSSVWSSDTLFTDRSVETALSDYNPTRVSIEDVEIESSSSFDMTATVQQKNLLEETYEILPTREKKDQLQIENETQSTKDGNPNPIQSSILTTTSYHLKLDTFKFDFLMRLQVVHFHFNEVLVLQNYSNLSTSVESFLNEVKKDKHHYSLIKYPSQLKPVSRQTDRFLNNLISEGCIQHNLLQRFTSPVPLLNYESPISQISNHEDYDVESMQQISNLTEESLAAYQCMLASATCNAEIDDRFYLSSFFFDGSLPSEQKLFRSSLRNNSEEASSEELVSLFDEFENLYYEDDCQDYAIVEAANLEALANDFDGFYSQEFGLYSVPELLGKDKVYDICGYFGSVCQARLHSGRNGRFGSREPILSPITECSEHSYFNSCMSPALNSPSSFGNMTSPRLDQFSGTRQMEDYESIEKFDSSFKLREV